jgi:hypothetical protein
MTAFIAPSLVILGMLALLVWLDRKARSEASPMGRVDRHWTPEEEAKAMKK